LDDRNQIFEDEDELEDRFYDGLLARASKNAKENSYSQQAEDSLLDDMLLRQIRFDDYPIWKIKCRVRQPLNIQ
jgi:hypothetical protein